MTLPPFHESRFELNDEVHARPSQSIAVPSRVSYLVLVGGPAERQAAIEAVQTLAQRYDVAPPMLDTIYDNINLGPFRLTWERHTEFIRYTFSAPAGPGDPFADPAINLAPEDWVASLPGQVMVAAHVAIVRPPRGRLELEEISKQNFASNMLIGSSLFGGAAVAVTDFRIHGDGFSRFLIQDRSMNEWQAGRIVQRLLEIDTYRVMALLTLPVARKLGPDVAKQERELSQITGAMVNANESSEATLLDRLSRLQAGIEDRHSSSHYRFSAANAYYDIVKTRIEELREDRIEGLQTFGEFTERRLAPAMQTCNAVANRQVALAERVARTTQLLSTRVGLTRERQNQSVLESMNRRTAMQLRLQETVEGLSIAAVTYYVVGLILYLAKAVQALGVAVDPPLVAGLSVPLVVILVAFGVRSVRNRLLPASKMEE